MGSVIQAVKGQDAESIGLRVAGDLKLTGEGADKNGDIFEAAQDRPSPLLHGFFIGGIVTRNGGADIHDDGGACMRNRPESALQPIHRPMHGVDGGKGCWAADNDKQAIVRKMAQNKIGTLIEGTADGHDGRLPILYDCGERLARGIMTEPYRAWLDGKGGVCEDASY